MSGAPGSPHAPVASGLPKHLRIVGTVSSAEDLRIDGEIEGEIEAPSCCVVVSEGARVTGTLFARDVTVEGSFSGKITAVEIVDIRERARVTADIVTPGVIVADGASVHGRVETKRADAAVRVARYRMERREQG